MIVCGVDEVGTGAVAGPIYIVAAAFDGGFPHSIDIRDSKKMTPAQRRRSFEAILEVSASVGLGMAWPDEINQLGVRACWERCVRRAVDMLRVIPAQIVIDGGVGVDDLAAISEVLVVPHADATHWQVSAASILAKVMRDDMMEHLATEYPVYGWDSNKGYLSAAHTKGLKAYGPCVLHRMWKGVVEHVR